VQHIDAAWWDKRGIKRVILMSGNALMKASAAESTCDGALYTQTRGKGTPDKRLGGSHEGSL